MSEIKFRAWDKQNKYFCNHIDVEINGDGDVSVYDGYNNWICAGEMELDISMFTGLKDKNGNEIYEGDIVEHDHPNYGYGDPAIPEKTTTVVPNIPSLYEDCEDDWGEVHNLKRGEVIGNIYENPELLKEIN